jgi:nucleotide-binding universal stress UspA family protein
MGRFWLGSVAYELLRQLPMPLLLAHPHGEAIDWSTEPRLKQFLVPLDGSSFAEQILEPVAALAGFLGAGITLERVLSVVPLDHPGIDHVGLSSPALQVLDQVRAIERQVREQAEQYLSRIAERLRARGLRVRTQVVVAERPAIAILEETKTSAVDLVALATHGRRGLSRVLLGSVADKVIRAASVPVLVQRPLCQ